MYADLGPDRALLTVTDTGPGFAADREGFGLRGMRRRVRGVGERSRCAARPRRARGSR
ncbi:hypothetical protein ACFQZ4_02180 [Catellatospora coxensis]